MTRSSIISINYCAVKGVEGRFNMAKGTKKGGKKGGKKGPYK